MKKITFILVSVICITLVGCTTSKEAMQKSIAVEQKAGNKPAQAESKGRPPVQVTRMKVKITADNVNIRRQKSVNSQIIGQLPKNSVIDALIDDTDNEGRTWYMVDASFGVTGWVAGWLCKVTDEPVNTRIKSEPGELLSNCPDKVLFAELLMMDDYSLDNLLRHFGSGYKIYKDKAYEVYEYKNGLKLEVAEGKNVVTIGLGDQSIRVGSIMKKECDILKEKGNEIVVFNEDDLYYELIIINKDTRQVLMAYETDYLYIDSFEIGDFLNDGSKQLYVSGSGDGILMKDIYRVSGTDFIKVHDIDSFDLYREGIKTSINNSILSLDFKIGDYTASEKTVVPRRVFYNTERTEDKNKLLSLDKDWNVVQMDGRWYINVRYTVDITMLTYYWGPPEGDTRDNSVMKNDLARIDVLLDMGTGEPVISKVGHRMKYDDVSLLGIKPMLDEEGAVVNGPALGTSMEEAYKALGGDMENYEYSADMEYNGVTISEFCSEVVGITVENDRYATVRGMKVGDTIEQVESLYGKPDIGFSGDSSVEYKFCYGAEGALTVDFYRTLTVYYKDGLVSSYKLYQVILD